MPKFSTTGLFSGAATGASMGSAAGPLGTLVGGTLGALGGGLFGKAGAKKAKFKQVNQLHPLQQALFGQMGQGLQGGYGQAFDVMAEYLNPESGMYDVISQPALNQFYNQIVPNLAERFAGRGALSSSGFGQALGAAGSDLSAKLAAMRGDMQRKAAGDIFGQAQNFMGVTPYMGYMRPGLASPVGQALGSFAGQMQPSDYGKITGDLSSLWENFGPLIGNV